MSRGGFASIIIGLLLASAARAQDPFIVSAWVDMDADQERRALAVAGTALDELDLFNFSINASGGFAERAVRDHARFIAAAHERGTKVSITFVDFVGAAHQVMASEALTRRFASTLARACAEHGLDGADIDFERLKRTQRETFSRFVRTVASELHARGKTLSVSVYAKTTDAGDAGHEAAQDLAALGAAADQLKLMTYDYSGSWSGPGAIGPMTWARRVVEYCRSVGVPAAKLILGIPLYGRTWPGGRNIGPTSAARLAREHGSRVHFDPALGESHFRAGATTVWFTDGRSVAAKVRLARELGLGGVACFSMKWASDGHLDALARSRQRGSLSGAVTAR